MVSNFFVTNGITIVCMVYITLILIVYFLKDRTNNIASKVYVALLFATIITMISFILWGTFSFLELSFVDIFGKIFSFIMVCWNIILVFYMSIAFKSDEENRKKINKSNKLNYIIGFILVLLNLIFVIFLDFKTNKIDSIGLYSMGGGLYNYVNIMGGVSVLYATVVMFIYRKRLDTLTKVLGVFVVLIVCVSIITGVTGLMPLNDMCFLHTLVIMFLYLSIESQDRNLLLEFNESTKSAEESNKLKSEFIMNMSHQLRTPMNTILGFSDSLLNNEKLTQAILIEDSNDIEVASKRLLELINSILDISKLESNKEVLNKRNYNLDSVIYDISSHINSQITKDNCMFIINANEDCPNELVGDDIKLAKILNIFLSNAVKYTNYGEVSLNISANQIDSLNYEFIFHIKNSGHLMKQENFDVSFDDLIKLNSNGNNDIDANTLKIVVAKRLLELIGGSIEFINESGKGTQYIIKVNQNLYGQNRIGNIKEKIQVEHNFIHGMINLESKRVLIIDEKKINSIILQRLLSQYNISVDVTVSPRDGIDFITKNNYDMAFITHDMDDMGGSEVVSRLESTGNKLPILIGMVTLSSDVLDDVYNDLLNCPIELRELNKLIKKYFDRKE